MNISINQIKNNNEWEIYHRIRKEQIFNPNNVVYNKNHPTITSTCHYHFVLYNDINIVTVAHIEL